MELPCLLYIKDVKMVQTEKLGDSVRAVDRALEILLAFTASDHKLAASELLKRVDLSRPTLYRLLRTLEHNGFIVSTGDPQKFQLGPSVAHLAHVWTSSLDIAAIAQPMMRRLWEKTSETVALLMHQGDSRVCVAELPSAQPLSFKRGVGYIESVALGASGRAILAYVPDPKSYLMRSPQLNIDATLVELEVIRKTGYAISKDELIQGAVAVAAPFFMENDLAVGSLAVFGPSARVDQEQIEVIAKLLKEEAKNLSKVLGQRQ